MDGGGVEPLGGSIGSKLAVGDEEPHIWAAKLGQRRWRWWPYPCMPAQKINEKANAELERCANDQQNEGVSTAAGVAPALTYAEEISIASAINRLYEMAPDAVTKRERVVEVLPMRARDDKGAPVRELPAHEGHAGAEPRVHCRFRRCCR